MYIRDKRAIRINILIYICEICLNINGREPIRVYISKEVFIIAMQTDHKSFMRYIYSFRINYTYKPPGKILTLADFYLLRKLHYLYGRQDTGYISITDDRILCCFSFCPRHGPEQAQKQEQVPPDLLGIAEFMMPKLIFRLVQHLRDNFRTGTCTLQIMNCST